MHVDFHVCREDIQVDLSPERTVDGGSSPFRVLTIAANGNQVHVFMTTQQVFELLAALAEGLLKLSSKPKTETYVLPLEPEIIKQFFGKFGQG